MKKKALILGTCLCMMFAAVGCSKDSESTKNEENTKNEESTESKVTVSLGQYKGLEYTLESTDVTEDEVQSYLDSFQKNFGTPIKVTDRKDVRDGDIVNIDYEGKIDGKAFEGGSAKDTDLTIGSGQFIPGFEEGLVGWEVGTTDDLKVTFPKEYKSEELAGKDAVFTVTINYIDSGKREELTDEVIAANDSNGNKTIEEYKEYVKNGLKESKEQNAQNQKELDVMKEAIKNAKFEGIEQKEIDELEEQMKKSYEAQAAQFGIDLATYVNIMFNGMTIEEFNKELKTAADFNIHQKYLINEVVKEENLTLTDEEYKKTVKDYMEMYSYTDEEKFVTDFGGEDEVRNAGLMDKAVAIIVDSAVEVK